MNIMRQMARLQKTIANVTARLDHVEVTGESGGGMVKVVATAGHRIRSITIEQALLDTGDREMLESLLVAGLNQALDAASVAARKHAIDAVKPEMRAGLDTDPT